MFLLASASNPWSQTSPPKLGKPRSANKYTTLKYIYFYGKPFNGTAHIALARPPPWAGPAGRTAFPAATCMGLQWLGCHDGRGETHPVNRSPGSTGGSVVSQEAQLREVQNKNLCRDLSGNQNVPFTYPFQLPLPYSSYLLRIQGCTVLCLLWRN